MLLALKLIGTLCQFYLYLITPFKSFQQIFSVS